MRILVYGINYSPELTGIGKYTGEMCEWLAAQGHEIRIVTAPPYYPSWKIGEGYSSLRYKKENLNGVEVFRCPLWIPQTVNGLRRILHLASFALSSVPIMLSQIFWRPDVVFVVEPPLFCAPTALVTSLLCRAKSWLHIQDFEVDAAFSLGIIQDRILRRLVLTVEKRLTGCFGIVSTISSRMMDRLGDKGVAPDKQVYFPNWVDGKSIFPMPGSSPFRKELNINNNAFVALYSGNMGEKQGLEVIIETARLLVEDNNIIFVMCGDGAAYSRLRELANGLSNIVWLPLQPLQRLNELLNLADVHLLPQKVDAEDLVMPSKLTGMLSSGRPVLATAKPGSQIAKVLEGCGKIVMPEDCEAFSNALQNIFISEGLRKKMGENARRYALEFLDREAVLKDFESCLFQRVCPKIFADNI